MRLNLESIARAVLPVSIYRRLAHSEIGRRFAKGTFWSLMNSLIGRGATFVQAILLARILGISSFGKWGILLSTIAMIQEFASFSLAVAAIKYVALWQRTHIEKLGRLLALLNVVAIAISLPTCLILFFGSDTIARNILSEPQLATPLALASIIIFVNSLSGIYQGVLTGFEQFQASAWISCGSTVIGVVFAVCLASTYGITGAIFGLLFANILGAITYIWYALQTFKDLGIKVRFSRCWEEWKGIWNYAIPSTLTGLIITASFWLAQVILVRHPNGYEAMGAYHAANQWRTIIIFLPTQLMAAYLPVMSSLQGSDPEKLRRIQNKILISIMLFTCMIALPVMLTAPWLMQLYGREFTTFTSTLVVMALLPIVDIGHLVLQQSAIVHGYLWFQLVVNSTLLVVVAIGAYLLIPHYLALGLAYSLFLGYTVRLFAAWLLFRSQTKKLLPADIIA